MAPHLLLLGLLFTAASGISGESIAPNDKRITIAGCQYPVSAANGVTFFRHSPAILKMSTKESGFNAQKAATNSGVELRFSMKAPIAQLRFEFVHKENRGAEFGVFVDGQLVNEQKFWKTAKQPMVIDVRSKNPAVAAACSVTLPSFSAVRFLGMEFPQGGELLSVAEQKKRPVYVALGDSISHGVGQGCATHRTWPFLLARSLDYELYNLAVGGGKISLPTADMLAELPEVSVVSILIGYNDWCGEGKTVAEYRSAYDQLVRKVRAHQPKATILCISPLYTRTEKSKRSGLPLPPFRAAVEAAVAEVRAAGDENVLLLKGDTITDASFLRGEEAPQDPVHLGPEGARRLALAVQQFLKSESNLPIVR